MQIIDTHQHLWDLQRFAYSWCQTIPPLNRSFLMPDYLAAVEGLNLEQSVHLEADVDEPYLLDETKYILALAEQANPLTGVVAAGRPEHADFPAYLARLAGPPHLKGVRRVLHTQPDDLARQPLFIEHVQLLADYDLSFDICMLAHQLPAAINLIERCPRVSFILDHCGNPRIKEQLFEPWQTYLRELAALPNVVCKISGIVTNASANWTAEDLRPFVNRVIELFGWDRVMFGSDWPVCTLAASFKEWVDALLFLTKEESDLNRQKLFRTNAQRVYRLK